MSGNTTKENVKESFSQRMETTKSTVVAFKNYVVRWTMTFGPFIVVLFISSFGILEALGVDTGIPSQLVPYVIYASYGFILGLLPAELIRQWISSDDRIPLVTYDTKASRLSVWKVPQHYWSELDILGPDDEKEMNVDDLDNVHLTEGRGYLAQDYDPNENKATASWLAGKDPIDLRIQKEQLGEATQITWMLAEAAVKTVSQRENIAREAALKEILENVEHRENINLESSPNQTDVEDILRDNEVLDDDIIGDIQSEIRGDNDE